MPDADASRDALVGQEAVQAELYRILSNFAREGRPNRITLLHGPNGSAKSTAAACIMRALEDYSIRDEGALYRFHWVFPNQSTLRGSIGFGGGEEGGRAPTVATSYAHLPEDEIDARLFIEVRDHPLFLLPQAQRAELLERLYREAGAEEPPPAWILRGSLSHKSRQVYEALLLELRRLARGGVAARSSRALLHLAPLSRGRGHARARSCRSTPASGRSPRTEVWERLPSSLQAVTLFEAFGELIDAAGGVLEFSDLLKRPLDAFKYLQITAETGEVALRSQNVQVNCVMIASGNEVHLSAFREHPEFESFRGRLELVRMPYLRSWVDEQRIYDAQIAPQVRKHVAPHATQMAAMFAVADAHAAAQPRSLRKAAAQRWSASSPRSKRWTCSRPAPRRPGSTTRPPSCCGPRSRSSTPRATSYPIYEGSTGASPREMRSVLLDAAQSPRYECLSPLAVLDGSTSSASEPVSTRGSRRSACPAATTITRCFAKLCGSACSMRSRTSIASPAASSTRRATSELFDRYVTHVSFWVKGEKLRNPVTGQYEDPDERLMREVEALLGSPDRAEQLRHSLISTIAAWAIDHPGQSIDNDKVFSGHLKRLREAVFAERRGARRALVPRRRPARARGEAGLTDQQKAAARAVIAELEKRFGYEESSAADAALALVRERFADLLH